MRPGHALVVDDDETIREVAQLALELVGGWRVSTAANGTEAVRLARTERPDVILLDVMMPVVDGPATLDKLREDTWTRDIPVVYLTAKANPEQEYEWVPGGATGVIAKPFDPMTLADDVSRLLEQVP
ncbi:response regulator [Georgenia halophila]|uniref:Response regulator n=1 Tax=Georgenia halophila TaxID=620889 RepID=A0ABP8KT86_9MICO